MNIPSKIAKSNILLPNKVSDFQNTSSKYYKQYNKIKKQNDLEKTTINGKKFKEEIISWFFSLDLLTRLIISSIENKWVTSLITQLYNTQKFQPGLKFQIKEGILINFSNQNSQKMDSEYCHEILRLKVNDNNQQSYISCGNTYSQPNNIDCFNYLNYFINNDNSGNFPIYNSVNSGSYSLYSNKTHEDFLNELKFYKSEELLLESDYENVNKYSNYFTLSEKILQDEKLFRYFFDNLSMDRCFNNLIPVAYERNTKNYNIFLPEWIKSKEYYSVSEIIVGFFEQVIIVNYINYKQNPQMFKSHTYIEQVHREKENMINFLKNLKKTKNNAGDYLLNFFREKNILEKLNENPNVRETITNKFLNTNNSILFYFSSANYSNNEHAFDRDRSIEIHHRIESILRSINEDDNEPKFVENLIYLNIDKILTFEDFLFRTCFEFINEIIQKESYLDLLNDNDNLEDCKSGKLLNKTKKKKKKKSSVSSISNDENVVKNKVLNSQKDLNTDMSNPNNSDNKYGIIGNNNKVNNPYQEEKKYEFSFIKRNVRGSDLERKEINNDFAKNNNTYTEKEFLGKTMLIKKETNSIFEYSSTSEEIQYTPISNSDTEIEIENMVKDILDRILTTVSFNLNFQHDYEKNITNLHLTNHEDHIENLLTEKIKSISNDNILDEIKNFTDKEDMINIFVKNDKTNTNCNTTINSTNNNKRISEKDNYQKVCLTDKFGSPSSYKNDLNDTDYSSDENLSNNKNTNKKKKKSNQFFLYNINPSKKINYNGRKNKNMNMFSNKYNTENINARKNSNTYLINDKKINDIDDGKIPLSESSNQGAADLYNKISDGNTCINNLILDVESTKTLIVEKEKENSIILTKTENNTKLHSKSLNLNIISKPEKLNISTSNKSSPLCTNSKISNNYQFVYPSNCANLISPEQMYFNNYGRGMSYNFRMTGINPVINPGISPGINPGINPGISPGINPAINKIPNNHNSNFYSNNDIIYPINYSKRYSSSTLYNNYHPFSHNDFIIFHNPLHFEFFEMRLNQDISNFYEKTEAILGEFKPFKLIAINYLEKIIKSFFIDKEFNLNSSIHVYGSFANELDIECSDIDMTIKLEDSYDYDYTYLMKKLVTKFNNLNVFDSVTPIYTASVPVIKIVLDPEKILDYCGNEEALRNKLRILKNENYPYKDEIETIKIDLTFLDLIIKKNNNINVCLMHSEYVRNSLMLYPEIKPIIKILKRFLQVNKLNCTFNGGLSSFCLFILVLASAKMHRFSTNNKNLNLGKLLIEFLLYYGSYLNLNFTLVDVNCENPYIILPNTLDAVPTILDPITYNNAGKSSFRIPQIQYVINMGYDQLFEIKAACETSLLGNSEVNVINMLIQRTSKISADNSYEN